MGDKRRAKDKDFPKSKRTTERELLKIEEEISRLEAEINSFLLRRRIFNLNVEALREGNFD
jgi:hypothetical protein